MQSLVLITVGVILRLRRPSRLKGTLAAVIPVTQWICTCRRPARAWAAAAEMHLNVATNSKKKKSLAKFRRVFSSQSALQGEVASENLLGQQMH